MCRNSLMGGRRGDTSFAADDHQTAAKAPTNGPGSCNSSRGIRWHSLRVLLMAPRVVTSSTSFLPQLIDNDAMLNGCSVTSGPRIPTSARTLGPPPSNLQPSPDIPQKLNLLRRLCEEEGRDYDAIEKTVPFGSE
jgi:hypothetical protein